MTTLRFATVDDAKELLQIYEKYIPTKTTFEDKVPSILEFSNRIAEISPVYPYLVCETNGHIQGYAYAHKFRERAAYQWSAEFSIYIEPDSQSTGLGKKLSQAVIKILALQGVQMLYSGVTVPNLKSEGLHQSLGFNTMGTYHNAGYKCGEWHSVKWFELTIGTLPTNPNPIIPVCQLSKVELKKIL